jgi:hypothetical protein
MSAIKKCTNCGADNDLIFTNCQFCKSPLPQIDSTSISNEDLIINAGEWVGKVGTSYTITSEDANAWTGKGFRSYQSSEIEGYALKYLSLLQVRASTNMTLKIVYDSLKKDFDAKRNSLFAKMGGGDKRMALAFIIFAAILIFGFFALIIPSAPDEGEKELSRLENIEKEVIEDIRNKNFDDALLIINGMEYSISWSGEGDSIPKRAWRNKKEGYLRTIRELQNK